MLTITNNNRKTSMTVQQFLDIPIIVNEAYVLPDRLGSVMSDVCDKHFVQPRHVLSGSREAKVVNARREFIAILHFRFRYLPKEIAALLNMDRTSVNHHLGLRRASKVKYDHLKSIYQ